MKKILKKLRASKFISKILLFFLKPVYRISKKIVAIIPRHFRPNQVTINYYGLSIFFPKNIGGSILNRLFWFKNGFEPSVGFLMQFFAKSSTVMIDVGSNIGFYSVISHKCNPSIKTYCIEPITELAQKNKKLHVENDIKNFETFQIALSDVSGSTEIFVPEFNEFNETSTSSLNKDFFRNEKQKGSKRTISTYTFVDFIHKYDIRLEKFFIVKIDVEGHEISVLKGFGTKIKEYKPLMFIELEMKEETIRSFFDLDFNDYYTMYKIADKMLIKVSYIDLIPANAADNFLLIPDELEWPKKNLICFKDM